MRDGVAAPEVPADRWCGGEPCLTPPAGYATSLRGPNLRPPGSGKARSNPTVGSAGVSGNSGKASRPGFNIAASGAPSRRPPRSFQRIADTYKDLRQAARHPLMPCGPAPGGRKCHARVPLPRNLFLVIAGLVLSLRPGRRSRTRVAIHLGLSTCRSALLDARNKSGHDERGEAQPCPCAAFTLFSRDRERPKPPRDEAMMQRMTTQIWQKTGDLSPAAAARALTLKLLLRRP